MGSMFGRYASKLEFKRSHARLLQRQHITEVEPGSILHDFESLLRYVRKQPLRVTGTHQLPLSSLQEINARLYHPLKLGLTRPQQKSYPPIHGLYLLLRASGLTYLDETGSKPQLMVDQELAAHWEMLNLTERYGTLLETWLLRAHPEIVGERAHAFFHDIPENYDNWLSLFIRLTTRPDEMPDYLQYTPGWHNLGLLELFGFLEIEQGAPVPGEGWQITALRSTPFGEALLTLLHTEFFSDLQRVLALATEGDIPPGLLQPLLRPYFPAWEQTLPLPTENPFREGSHIFKVTLWKGLWRRLAVPAEAALEQLASAILNAYNFDHDHLYDFRYKNRLGIEEHIYHPYMDEGPWVSAVRVGEIPLQPGQRMTFLYDYGDQWEFEVRLEGIHPADTEVKIRVLEAEGEAPEQYPQWEEDEGW